MMSQSIKVLVTAVGGDLGQGIVKALRLSSFPIKVVGCDITSESIGSAFVDSYHTVSPASDADAYLEQLSRLCRTEEIRAIFPASEAEITVLGRIKSFPKFSEYTVIICQNASWSDKYGDKLSCMNALQGKIDLAPFADGENAAGVTELLNKVGFPLVVKSRRGSGSRSFHIAHNETELKELLANVSTPVVQQFLDAPDDEYSVGLFSCDKFDTVIAFKRKLGPVGNSWVAETSFDTKVLDYARAIGDVTKLEGSANVQVRKTREGVRLLEINPRFSSLVAARAACGFKDAEWSLCLGIGEEVRQPIESYSRLKYRRFFHEVVDFGFGFHELAEWSPSSVRYTEAAVKK